MPNIARPARPNPSGSRLLLVRPAGSKAVRQVAPMPAPTNHIHLGVIVAVSVVFGIWLMGYLGFRLGFSSLVRVPDLIGDPGCGLATGVMIVIAIPRVIIAAGLQQPLWLMVGFAMIAVPAGGLAAARPNVPGAPKHKSAVTLIANIAAAASMLFGVSLLWWTSSPVRRGLLGGLPDDPGLVEVWRDGIDTAAGLDVLGVIAGALWLVLVMRLPIQLWFRVLASSAAFFTLVVIVVAMSISNGAASHITNVRSLGTIQNDPAPRLIIGATPHHTALLKIEDGHVIVERRAGDERIEVTRRQSIVGFLGE